MESVTTSAEGAAKRQRIDQPSAYTLSLAQLLTLCGLQRLLPHCPQLLLDRLQLSECTIRVKPPTSSTHSAQLCISARTGSHRCDRLLLAMGDLVVEHDWMTKHREFVRNAVVLKVMQRQLLTTRCFPGLACASQGTALRSFVYAEADSPLRMNLLLNEALQESESESKACLFPHGYCAPIPHGPHFLTVKHAARLTWTTLADALAVPPAPADAPSALLPRAAPAPPAASRPTFPIPTALLADTRCGAALARHVLSWLDANSMLLGLRRVSRALHASAVLVDGGWWKQRVQAEHGVRVVRWGAEALRRWRDEWLQEKTRSSRPGVAQSDPLTLPQRHAVQVLPLWYAAAVHLQTRVNRFAVDIMREPIAQLQDGGTSQPTSPGKKELLDQRLVGVDGQQAAGVLSASSAALQSPACYGIPSALLYVLLTSPPFQHASAYLMRRFQLWTTGGHQHVQQYGPYALAHPDLRWFAIRDGDQGTRYLALYVGTVYVHADQHTQHMGVDAEAGDMEQAMTEDEDDGDASDASMDDVDATAPSSGVRELYLPSVEQCPVLEWWPRHRELRPIALDANFFCIRRGVFTYTAKLDAMWDERAEAIRVPSIEPLADEEELQEMSEDEDSGEEEVQLEAEDSEVDSEEDDEMAEEVTAHPSYRVPFPVRFAEAMMDAMLSELEDSIHEPVIVPIGHRVIVM